MFQDMRALYKTYFYLKRTEASVDSTLSTDNKALSLLKSLRLKQNLGNKSKNYMLFKSAILLSLVMFLHISPLSMARSTEVEMCYRVFKDFGLKRKSQ